jgi:hypothetical protein
MYFTFRTKKGLFCYLSLGFLTFFFPLLELSVTDIEAGSASEAASDLFSPLELLEQNKAFATSFSLSRKMVALYCDRELFLCLTIDSQ